LKADISSSVILALPKSS
jgi:hypothetical protein